MTPAAPATHAAALHLHVRGVVATCECRTTPAGVPVLVLHLACAATGQEVRARHAYPDASHTSHYAAHQLARQMRGQVAELDALNPRFRARRIDCDALHITLPHLQPTARKDLE